MKGSFGGSIGSGADAGISVVTPDVGKSEIAFGGGIVGNVDADTNVSSANIAGPEGDISLGSVDNAAIGGNFGLTFGDAVVPEVDTDVKTPSLGGFGLSVGGD
ncbi:hypothetical protein, partial [Salmonella sp. s54395]|uniref:hypothetical protein n=1 Tax=Salmonella sp. s54395 TaxID=3159664 RepID=UPI003980AB5A